MELESGGLLRQKIVMFNFNTKFSPRVSLFGNYSLTFAKDLPSTPTDPYDFMLDYGRSNLDRRNNFQLTGSVIGPAAVRFAPFITVRSGAPYDVISGTDIFGDNGTVRADFAAANSCSNANVRCTQSGDFQAVTNAANLGNLIPRNYLTMPGLFSVNMRIYRVFGFGAKRGANAAAPDAGPGGGGPPGGGGGGRGGGGGGGGGGARSGGGPGGGGMRMGAGGGGGRGGGGGETTDRRFNMTLGVNFSNILNHFNPGGYNGNMTSPTFLQPTSINTGFGGGGVGGMGAGSVANNRRVDMSVRFTF
jgi:hypothetical protein